jgi:signal transduction histidine kinase
MSYRAFKRLLGETSLERKCRILFGIIIAVLISGSFWLYARQTEHLAYDQITKNCRLLVEQILDQQLATRCRPAAVPADAQEQEKIAAAIKEFRDKWEERWRLDYFYRVLKLGTPPQENRPHETYDAQRLKEFQEDEGKQEETLVPVPREGRNYFYYYGAIRATPTCIDCHAERNKDLKEYDLKENGLIALIKIEVPTDALEDAVHANRALLITIALVTALLIWAISYFIIRYVIVKPVKHLKEVSDAISAGQLNVRSEIQTGDEFEDLSDAFNRMLRKLMSMQEDLRGVKGDLENKVDELARANLALYESNRLKSDFLATVSHELRTPLNSILGFSEVLRSAPGLSDKQGRWVGNIHSSGEQLLNLINDILDLAKIEAGKMEVRLTEFSIYDVCEGLLTMFRPLAEKKNIDLRGVFAPGIPLLRQDVVKFRQILSNLLSNAIKFTPEGGRVVLKADADGPEVVLTVTDTGVGIAAEEQETIFEKFRQAGSALTREHAGTGLGLSIVRELAKLLGGSVALRSELGRGSTFMVRLPLHRGEEPRLEFSLAGDIDLSKAQRVDGRLYGAPAPDDQVMGRQGEGI